MIERFVDKEIRILEAILHPKDDGYEKYVINEEVGVTSSDIKNVFKMLDAYGLIKLKEIFEIPYETDFGEITSPEYISLSFELLDKEKIEGNLLKLKNENPKRTKPLLKVQTTELMAKAICGAKTDINLIDRLIKLGIDKIFLPHPKPKWENMCEILNYLCLSGRDEDREILNKLIEEFCHPITHDGNAEEARHFEKEIDSWVQHDDFRVINGEFVEIGKLPEYLILADERNNKRVPCVRTSGLTYCFQQQKKKGVLTIPDREPILFTGRRADIVDIFYHSTPQDLWYDYALIKRNLKNSSSKNFQLRKDIQSINKRVYSETQGEIDPLIRCKNRAGDSRGTLLFKWGL